MFGLTGVHLLIILGIVVLLFGATKLPALAKGLGQSITIFKKEMGTDGTPKEKSAEAATAESQSAEPVATQTPVVQPTTVHPSAAENNR